MEHRKFEFDNLKGILIYLVVIGHLTFTFSHANTELAMKITSFIYFFHMPLFLIISGYFSKNTISKKMIIKLLFFFLCMNISFTIYDYYATGVFSLLMFKYSSWYILLLLIYRLLFTNHFVQKIIREHSGEVLLGSLVVALLAGYLKTDLFILRIFENFFYFLFGYLLKMYKPKRKIECNKFFLGVLFLFLFAIIFLVTTEYSFHIGYYLGESYTRMMDIIVKFILCITNVSLFLVSIQLIPKKHLPLLTNIGRNSLYIYILHRIPTLIITEFVWFDRKLVFVILVLWAFLLCLILSLHIVTKIVDFVTNFFVDKYLNRNVFVILITILFLGILLYCQFYWKTIPNFKSKNTLDDDVISIGFVGDLILLENQVKYSRQTIGYQFDYMFSDMKKYFDDTDYTIGVFEGPSDDSQAYSVGNYSDNKELRINHPSQFINSIKKSGIDLVTLANNHVYDRGYQGALATISNLSNKGMDFVGSGKNNPQRKIIEMYGLKVGFLAYTFYSNYPNDSENSDLVHFLVDPDSRDFDKVVKDVKNDFSYLKKNNVDLIIILPHYGTEFNFDFSRYQEKWNEVFVENGADIVFGDHSHVIGPVMYKNDSVMVSSPGNYVNSYNGQDSDISQYVKVFVDKKTKKIVKTTSVPMLAVKDKKGYYPVALSDLEKKDKNNERVKQALSIFGKVVMRDENIKLKNEYVISKKQVELKPLELIEEDKNSSIYKKLSNSRNVCFIGDSITEGTKNDYHPWYEELISHFDSSVTNISKGGYTTHDLLDEFSDDIKNSSCDLAVINIGTNDIRYNRTSSREYRQNINQIISLLGKDTETILLSPWETYSNDKIIGDFILEKKDLYGKYNQELISLASKSDRISYVNPIRYIKSYIYRNGEDTYLLDGVHPNDDKGIKLYSYSLLRGEGY